MKAIFIDDEALALDYLDRQIKKISNIDIAGKFITFEIEKHITLLKEIDLVFLDIEMPETNGLELAEKILEINSTITIIFITAYQDYAVQAFELNALDYIIKPVQLDRLQRTVERIQKNAEEQIAFPLLVNETLRINVCRDLTFGQIENNKIIHWRTAKAQELFLYLLLYTGKTIHKAELIEILWPELESKKAYSQLYTAIYHVRKALNELRNHLSIRTVQDGYVLYIENTLIDIVEWEKRITNAPPINKESIDDFESNMNLYTGAYLQKYDYLWVEPERFRLEHLWIKAAYQLANFYTKEKEPDKAISWYMKIHTLRPEDESAHFYLMKLYATLGLGILVNHQYNLLKRALNELNIPINPMIQDWYDQWHKNK